MAAAFESVSALVVKIIDDTLSKEKPFFTHFQMLPEC